MNGLEQKATMDKHSICQHRAARLSLCAASDKLTSQVQVLVGQQQIGSCYDYF